MQRIRDCQVKYLVDEELRKLTDEEQRFNILLVGPKGTGKTSFLKLFIAKFIDYLTTANGRAAKGFPVIDLDISKFLQQGEYLLSTSFFNFKIKIHQKFYVDLILF